MTEAGWRDDPRWQLADYDAGYWATQNRKPPPAPPENAELAQPPAWCSVIATWDGTLRPVATWYRPLV